MKIGYICSDVDVQLFGHEGCSIHIREFVNALAACGHEVFIICAWVGEHDPKALSARVYPLEPEGLHATAWHSLENEPVVQDHHLERDLRCVLANGWLVDRGARILASERPDFLYERYSLFGWGGVELSRRFGVPLVLEVNAPLCQEQSGYEKFPLNHTAEQMEPEIFRRADGIVSVSQWLKNWIVLQAVEETRVHVIPNAVAESLFRVDMDGERVRRCYGLEGKQVIGYVGSFQSWHDVSGIITAFCELRNRNDNLRLLLVGDGPQRGSLQRKVQQTGMASSVVFTGNAPHEQIPEFLGAMDIAVVPYGKEAVRDFYFSPLKLFECMASGRPVVAAAVGQIKEIVNHGKTGWLYPPGDQKKLIEGLEALLNSSQRANQIGNAGRRYVLREHTWSAAAKRIVQLAQALIVRPSQMTSDPASI